MAKPLYAHYFSNLPTHLLNSLPFSQGIRIVRICSNISDRNTEIQLMLDNFKYRCYPNNLLDDTRNRLESLDRFSMLTPKKSLIIGNLSTHHPEILRNYKVKAETSNISKSLDLKSYLVLPFYKSLSRLGNITIDFIRMQAEQSNHKEYVEILSKIHMYVSYSKVKSIQTCILGNIMPRK